MAWTKETLTASGAYWAILHAGLAPELLYINQFGLLMQFGSRELLSFAYDIYMWWDQPVIAPQ
jgi:hypothetical protein